MLAARAAAVPEGVFDAVTVGSLATISGAAAKFDALEQFISSAARYYPGSRFLLTTPNPTICSRDSAADRFWAGLM